MSEPADFRLGRADGSLVSRKDLVAEARSWLGTPFVHLHSMKGHACDCVGFLRGVSAALGLVPIEQISLLPEGLRTYAGRPDGVTMREGFDSLLRGISIAAARPGDLLLLRFGHHPQHTALLGDYRHGGLSMIHALGPGGPGKVVEHRLDETWRKRIVGVYAIPGVE